MGFFYISLLSIVPLTIAYAAVGCLFLALVRLSRGLSGRKIILAVGALALIALPIGEELWIAWKFGQACKHAGLSIYKKVQVDGFYDDTAHWWRQLSESKFAFVESRDPLHQSLWRAERTGNEIRHFKIDRPTARYHFTRPHNHTPVAHKVRMFEYLVRDVHANEILAREQTYAREAPWYSRFFDRRTLFCPVSGEHGQNIRATIYELALQPNTVP